MLLQSLHFLAAAPQVDDAMLANLHREAALCCEALQQQGEAEAMLHLSLHYYEQHALAKAGAAGGVGGGAVGAGGAASASSPAKAASQRKHLRHYHQALHVMCVLHGTDAKSCAGIVPSRNTSESMSQQRHSCT